MATASGVTGNVTLVGGYVTNVKAWTLDDGADVNDITSFASVGPRSFLGGLTSWSGTYTCDYDDTVLAVAPGAAAAQIVLTAVTGQTFTGNVIITSNSISASVEGPPQIVVSFQGTGVLGIA